MPNNDAPRRRGGGASQGSGNRCATARPPFVVRPLLRTRIYLGAFIAGFGVVGLLVVSSMATGRWGAAHIAAALLAVALGAMTRSLRVACEFLDDRCDLVGFRRLSVKHEDLEYVAVAPRGVRLTFRLRDGSVIVRELSFGPWFPPGAAREVARRTREGVEKALQGTAVSVRSDGVPAPMPLPWRRTSKRVSTPVWPYASEIVVTVLYGVIAFIAAFTHSQTG